MPFSFERADRSVEAAIQRLSLEQIDLALSAIAVAVDKEHREGRPRASQTLQAAAELADAGAAVISAVQ